MSRTFRDELSNAVHIHYRDGRGNYRADKLSVYVLPATRAGRPLVNLQSDLGIIQLTVEEATHLGQVLAALGNGKA